MRLLGNRAPKGDKRERGALRLPRWLRRRQDEQSSAAREGIDPQAQAEAQFRKRPRRRRRAMQRSFVAVNRQSSERAFRRTFKGIVTQRTATQLAKVGARQALGLTTND